MYYKNRFICGDALKENTLFGIHDKVQIALDRLKKYCPPEGYYVAFSGGKDSVVILDLVKRSGLPYDAHYNVTTVDPPELVKFIRKEYPLVKFEHPKMSMWKYIVKKGPPLRQKRWCCTVLKERNPDNRTIVTGIRWEESFNRKKRDVYEKSKKAKNTYFLNPIIDWTELNVWNYIEDGKLGYCGLYDDGHDRLGCILCPMRNSYEYDNKRWPKIVAAYKRAFKRFWDRKILGGSKSMRWKDFDDFWNWWISRDAKQVNIKQQELF